MAEITDSIQNFAGMMRDELSARAVYGEPIRVEGRTVVPVAKVSFGFGFGGGSGPQLEQARRQGMESVGGPEREGAPMGQGVGGGGGGMVQPMGFIDVSDVEARWVPVGPHPLEVLLRVATVGAFMGWGKPRSFVGRTALMLVGQALIGRLMRPNVPMMPGRMMDMMRRRREAA